MNLALQRLKKDLRVKTGLGLSFVGVKSIKEYCGMATHHITGSSLAWVSGKISLSV